MLMNLLNSHPDICCNSDSQTADILSHGDSWAFEQGFLGCNGKACGFLLKTKTKVHERIRPEQKLKVIFLTRDNKLEVFLSKEMAGKYGCYEKNGVALSDAAKVRLDTKPIFIDKSKLHKFFKDWESDELSALQFIEKLDNIKVSYEDLVLDKQAVTRDIFNFLNLNEYRVSSTSGRGSEKLDRRTLVDSILNYQELKKYFSKTSYYRYFKE